MTTEYQSLAYISLFFLLAWIPSSIAKYQTFGLKWLASNRHPIEGKSLDSWGARCERAHNNLKDNLPAFIVAIILLGLTERFTETTAVVSIAYVVGRIAHFVSYGIGNTLARAMFFFVGLFSNIYLLIKVVI